MRPLQVLHPAATVLLLVAVIGFGVLVLAEVVEVRLPAKGQPGDWPAFDPRAGASGNRAGEQARLVVVRGAKPGMSYPLFEGRNILGRADEKPVEIDLEFQESPERIWSSRQHAVITCEGGSLAIEDLRRSRGNNSSGGNPYNRHLPTQEVANGTDGRGLRLVDANGGGIPRCPAAAVHGRNR
jgi:hypothetical protein